MFKNQTNSNCLYYIFKYNTQLLSFQFSRLYDNNHYIYTQFWFGYLSKDSNPTQHCRDQSSPYGIFPLRQGSNVILLVQHGAYTKDQAKLGKRIPHPNHHSCHNIYLHILCGCLVFSEMGQKWGSPEVSLPQKSHFMIEILLPDIWQHTKVKHFQPTSNVWLACKVTTS